MDLHHPVPILFTEADEHAVTQHTGVVNHHMHFTKRRQCRIDNPLCGHQCGDVIVVGDGLATVIANLLRHRLRGFAANIVDHHIRPLRGQRQRVGTAQPAASPGDDHGAVCTYSHV